MNATRHEFELLIHATDNRRPYGCETPYGRLWAATKADLLGRVRFIFGVREAVIISQRLTDTHEPETR